MNSSAFLVEGHLEQKFIQRVCSDRPVRRINCNGRNASINAIAARVATQCRLFGNRYFPIVIIFDREERAETSEELCNELIKKLKNERINDTLIVGVADRTIENWILADRDIVNKHPENKAKAPQKSEGLHGKQEIGKCISKYHETTIGVELLVECRASIIRQNSLSFSNLYSQLPHSECRWLKR